MVFIQCYNLNHTVSPNTATPVGTIQYTLEEEVGFELETVYRTNHLNPTTPKNIKLTGYLIERNGRYNFTVTGLENINDRRPDPIARVYLTQHNLIDNIDLYNNGYRYKFINCNIESKEPVQQQAQQQQQQAQQQQQQAQQQQQQQQQQQVEEKVHAPGGGSKRRAGLPKLSEKDHELIIKHYGKVLPKTKRGKKSKSERLVAQKLCSCIKKVLKKSKKKKLRARAIGICSYAVVKNRGMKHHGFTCSKRSKIKKLSKTRKIVYKRPYKPRKKKKKRKPIKTKKKKTKKT